MSQHATMAFVYRKFVPYLLILFSTAFVPVRAVCLAEEPAAGPVAEPPAQAVMSVDEVRAGMRGVGKTVLRGTEITSFDAEVLGVMRGVGPGRDAVICKLSGANLDYTGVIAGMSGSPIYIDGKLLGAVAFAWSFNKEPIAGITPFTQMRFFAEQPLPANEVYSLTPDGTMPVAALDLSRDPFAALTSNRESNLLPVAGRTGQLVPLAVPLSAGGFGPRSLERLQQHFGPWGLLPVAAGGTTETAEPQPPTKIEPGASLSASLVIGDFDLSAVGTVTHVEGKQVWGWGHPFMEGGRCHYLLRDSFVHLINPKHDLSTKIASARTVQGVLNADVSTCVAGQLDAKPDLLPVSISIQQANGRPKREYHVQIVRHPVLLGALVATVLNGALEGSGAVGQEITIDLDATIRAAGLEPIAVKNTFSGTSVAGNAGAETLLNQVAIIADGLTRNPFAAARLDSIECHATITSRRSTAAILAARLASDELQPGDTLRATVTVRPYKGAPIDLPLSLDLPKSLEPGNYNVTICDATTHLKSRFAEEPYLLAAHNVEEVARAFRLQLEEKRQTLYLRLPVVEGGISVGDVNLPQLPASVQAAFQSRRASATRSLNRALVTRLPTDWVIEGSTSLRINVVKNKRATN